MDALVVTFSVYRTTVSAHQIRERRCTHFHPDNNIIALDPKPFLCFQINLAPIVYSFLTSALEYGGWSAPRPGRFTPGKEPVPIAQEAWWASGPVWTCAKNLVPTGIRSQDCPVRSQSLYRLSYPAHPPLQYRCYYTYVTGCTLLHLRYCMFVTMYIITCRNVKELCVSHSSVFMILYDTADSSC
jgi:hypothetical protein